MPDSDIAIQVTVDASGAIQILDRTGQALARVDAAAKGTGVSEASQKWQDFANKATGVNQALEILGKGFQVLQGILGGVKTAWDAFTGVAARGDELKEMAQRLGVNATALSSYKLALEESGSSIQGLAFGMKFLNQNIAQNDDAFKKLGISTRDAHGNLRSAEDVMLDLSDVFAQSTNDANKAAVAIHLFGRSGTEMIPFLNQGRAAILAMREEATKLGLVMSAELLDASDKYQDSLHSLGSAWEGVKTQLATGFLPIMADIITRIKDLVVDLGIGDGQVRAFGEQIGNMVDEFLKPVIDYLEQFANKAKLDGLPEALGQALRDAESEALRVARQLGDSIGNAIVDAIKESGRRSARDLASYFIAPGLSGPSKFGAGTSSTTGDIRDVVDIDAYNKQIAAVRELTRSYAASVVTTKEEQAAQMSLNAALVQTTSAMTTGTSSIHTTIDGHRTLAGVVKQEQSEQEKLLKTFEEQAKKSAEDNVLLAAKAQIYKDAISSGESMAEIQEKIAVATGKSAEQQALLKLGADGLTQQEKDLAHQIGETAAETVRLTDETKRLNAEMQIAETLKGVQFESTELQKVIDGTIQLRDAERAITEQKVLQQTGNAELANQYATMTDKVKQQREEIAHMVDLGKLLGDAFDQVLDGLIAGTLKMGDVLKSFGTSLFKQLFDNAIKDKLAFDGKFTANIIDLGRGILNILGGAFSAVFNAASSDSGSFLGNLANGLGGLFSGGSGGSGAGSIIGSLLFGGGGGSGGNALNLGGSIGQGLGGIGNYFGLAPWLANTIPSTEFVGPLLQGGFQGTTGAWSSLFGAGGGAGAGLLSFGNLLGYAGAGYTGYNIGYGLASGQGVDPLTAVSAVLTPILVGLYSSVYGAVIAAVIEIVMGIVGALMYHKPTAGTLDRRQIESGLDSLKTFADLQKSLGDISRQGWQNKTPFAASLPPEAVGQVKGFGAIFNTELWGDWDTGGGRQGIRQNTLQTTGMILDMFSRMKGSSEEVAAAIKENMRAALDELGIDLPKAMNAMNKASLHFFDEVNPKFQQGATTMVADFGQAVTGTISLFQDDFPAGVHLTEIALQVMEKNGVKAAGELTGKTKDALLELTKSAENTDKVFGELFKQGFTIDTEEFKNTLADITASADFLGKNISDFFNFDNATDGIQAIMDKLRETVSQSVMEGGMKQLFDTTRIAESFQPVFALLRQIDQFDLTTATGAQQFRDLMIQATLEGKANLEQYIPELKAIAEATKLVDDAIAEATKPTDLEIFYKWLGDIVEQAKSLLGSGLSAAWEAGLNVIRQGGTTQQALDAFNANLQQGIQMAILQAVVNAFIQAAVIEGVLAPMLAQITAILKDGIQEGDLEIIRGLMGAGFDAVKELYPVFEDFFGWAYDQAGHIFDNTNPGSIVTPVTGGSGGGGRTAVGGGPVPFGGGRGGHRTPLGAAEGGMYGPASMSVVGEAGSPELVIGMPGGGYAVVPLNPTLASALLAGGMTGMASGGYRPPIGGRNPIGGDTGGYSGRGTAPPPDPAHPYRPPTGPVVGNDFPRTGGGGGDTGGGTTQENLLVKFDFSSLMQDFAASGSEEDLQKALTQVSGQGIIDGIIQGMQTTGPIGKAIEEMNKTLSDATAKALEDGIVTEEEANHLGDLAQTGADELQAMITAMGPAFEAIAQRFGLGVQTEAIDVAQVTRDVLGNAVQNAFASGATFQEFGQSLQAEVFNNMLAGLSNAFIQGALVEGALGETMKAIQETLNGMADGTIKRAEAAAKLTALSAEAAGIIKGEDMQAAFKAMDDVVASLASNLGVTRREVQTSTDTINTGATQVAEKAQDVCKGQCGVEKELQTTSLGLAMLNRMGGVGMVSLEEWVPHMAGGGLAVGRGLRMLGENGPEFVLDAARTSAIMGMISGGFGGGGGITTSDGLRAMADALDKQADAIAGRRSVMMVDKQVLAEVVADEMEHQSRGGRQFSIKVTGK